LTTLKVYSLINKCYPTNGHAAVAASAVTHNPSDTVLNTTVYAIGTGRRQSTASERERLERKLSGASITTWYVCIYDRTSRKSLWTYNSPCGTWWRDGADVYRPIVSYVKHNRSVKAPWWWRKSRWRYRDRT